MLSRIAVLVLVATVGASRVRVHDSDEAKFGASCDDLQTTFHSRVGAFQASFDAIDSFETIGRATQARLLMRTYGIVRTLRRARTCSWVIEDNTDDIEQVRGIVQSLLAGNPCAEVARSELEVGASAETAEVEIRSIQRAMWVLTSDTCEVVEPTGQITDFDESAALDEMRDAEDNVQDAIDELADPSQEGESAFIQTDSQGFLRRLFRVIGVVFLMLFLALACTGALAFIGAVLGMLAGEFLWRHTPGLTPGMDALVGLYYGTVAGAAIGVAGCTYQLFTQLLPQFNLH